MAIQYGLQPCTIYLFVLIDRHPPLPYCILADKGGQICSLLKRTSPPDICIE